MKHKNRKIRMTQMSHVSPWLQQPRGSSHSREQQIWAERFPPARCHRWRGRTESSARGQRVGPGCSGGRSAEPWGPLRSRWRQRGSGEGRRAGLRRRRGRVRAKMATAELREWAVPCGKGSPKGKGRKTAPGNTGRGSGEGSPRPRRWGERSRPPENALCDRRLVFQEMRDPGVSGDEA